MTIDKREVITIPKWLMVIIIPLVMGGLGGYAMNRYNSGKQEKQIEINTKRLDLVETNKVDINEFRMIEESLGRIERKLDGHIDK